MQDNDNNSKINPWDIGLWIAVVFFATALLFARALAAEYLGFTLASGVPLFLALSLLVQRNLKSLRTRGAAYGLNSATTTILVISILGLLNFLTVRYPFKLDLTKDKLHTLSEQTVKLVAGLSKPVKATFFGKLQEKEQSRVLLESYSGLNPKFEVEFVDPDKEPSRARQANIRKYGTLLVQTNERESKIEEIKEEKITNELIKLLKDRSPELCTLSGHGEKNFHSQDAEGYAAIQKALQDQSYTVKEVNLLQEQKIPESCDALAIVGPSKGFFPAELESLKKYLNEGGRLLLALDFNLKGADSAADLLPLLAEWQVKPLNALVVDPLSRFFNMEATVAVLATFSKEHPITKDFKDVNCAFPFTRPLTLLNSADSGIKTSWLGETTPKSWAVSDLSALQKGGVVKPATDASLQGPLKAAVAVEGKIKDSKAKRATRLVVFGSALFATNQYSRMAGNLDFFVNSVSWLMEDDQLISIRTKEEGPGKVEFSSEKMGTAIFLLTVVLIPLTIAGTGVVFWWIRRRQ